MWITSTAFRIRSTASVSGAVLSLLFDLGLERCVMTRPPARAHRVRFPSASVRRPLGMLLCARTWLISAVQPSSGSKSASGSRPSCSSPSVSSFLPAAHRSCDCQSTVDVSAMLPREGWSSPSGSSFAVSRSASSPSSKSSPTESKLSRAVLSLSTTASRRCAVRSSPAGLFRKRSGREYSSQQIVCDLSPWRCGLELGGESLTLPLGSLYC